MSCLIRTRSSLGGNFLFGLTELSKGTGTTSLIYVSRGHVINGTWSNLFYLNTSISYSSIEIRNYYDLPSEFVNL